MRYVGWIRKLVSGGVTKVNFLYTLIARKSMFSFLLPFASKIISDAVNKIPDNEELGEKLIEVCLVILKKAVKLTKTDMDDKLLEQVEKAIVVRS